MILDQFKRAKEIQNELEELDTRITAMEKLEPAGAEKVLVRSDKFTFEIPARLLFTQVKDQLITLRQRKSQLQQEFNNL